MTHKMTSGTNPRRIVVFGPNEAPVRAEPDISLTGRYRLRVDDDAENWSVTELAIPHANGRSLSLLWFRDTPIRMVTDTADIVRSIESHLECESGNRAKRDIGAERPRTSRVFRWLEIAYMWAVLAIAGLTLCTMGAYMFAKWQEHPGLADTLEPVLITELIVMGVMLVSVLAILKVEELIVELFPGEGGSRRHTSCLES